MSSTVDLDHRRPRPRRRLVARAVARGALGRRRRPHAPRRGEQHQPRRLLVGLLEPTASSTSAGSTGRWTCSPSRHRREPRDADRGAADLAVPGAPRDPPRHRPRRAGLAGRPARLVAELPGVPPLRAAARRDHGRPLRRPPGPPPLAREQRARQRELALLQRRDLGRLRDLAGGAARHGRGAERRTGARPSGATATRRSTRSRHPASPARATTPACCSTSSASAATPCSATTSPSARCCARVTPDVPITTNFMIQNHPGVHDYAGWAREVDLVANDHYTIGVDPERWGELAFSADRTRGMSQGEPWLLIEHSTSAVNWQPRNRAKSPGELAAQQPGARRARGRRRPVLPVAPVDRGQRAAPLVGRAARRADSRVYREVEALGATLRRIGAVRGSTVEPARVAILFDEISPTALRSGRTPRRPQGADQPLAFHRALTRRGVAVDVVARRATSPATTSSSWRPSTCAPRRRWPASSRSSPAAAPSSSPRSPASSTGTTASSRAATPACSASCSACAPRSSTRCSATEP